MEQLENLEQLKVRDLREFITLTKECGKPSQEVWEQLKLFLIGTTGDRVNKVLRDLNYNIIADLFIDDETIQVHRGWKSFYRGIERDWTEQQLDEYYNNFECPSVDLDIDSMPDSVKELFEELQKLNKKLIVELGDSTLSSIGEIAESFTNKLVENQKNCKTTAYDWQIPENSTTDENRIPFIGYTINGRKITMEYIDELLSLSKTLLLCGVPGTGKTTLLHDFGNHKLYEGHVVERISFRPDYDYTDFIGGETVGNGGLFEYRDGVFLSLCKQANENRDKNFYLLIDEFSRGRVSSIFGEAMTLITDRNTVSKIGRGRTMMVPDNVYIVAAMNNEDREVSKLDNAIIDRFTRLDIIPQWTNSDYLKAVSNGNEEVFNLLNRLSVIMDNFNKEIIKQPGFTVDNVIGTRAITVEKVDINSIKDAIRTRLIHHLEYMNKSRKFSNGLINDTINRIEGILNNVEQKENK